MFRNLTSPTVEISGGLQEFSDSASTFWRPPRIWVAVQMFRNICQVQQWKFLKVSKNLVLSGGLQRFQWQCNTFLEASTKLMVMQEVRNFDKLNIGIFGDLQESE